MLNGDQAEGLRRLVTPASKRHIVVSGLPGSGKTSAAIHLAVNIAASGLRVCLLDADGGPAGVAALLGLRVQRAFSEVLQGRCALAAALLRGPHGVSVLSGADMDMTPARLPAETRLQGRRRMHELCDDFDVLVIDGDSPATLAWMDSPQLRKEFVFVLTPGFAAITEAYGLMKQHALEHRERRFLVLVNQVQNEIRARAVYENLASAARRFLDTGLAYLGGVRADSLLAQAPKAALHADAYALEAVADLRRIARRLMLPQSAQSAQSAQSPVPSHLSLLSLSPAARVHTRNAIFPIHTDRPGHVRWAGAGV